MGLGQLCRPRPTYIFVLPRPKMISVLFKSLSPPTFEDEVKTRLAGMLTPLLLAAIGLAWLAALGILMGDPQPSGPALTGILSLSPVFLGTLLHRGHVRTA